VGSGLNGLLAGVSYEVISPLYTAIKSFLCCTLADTLGNAWLALTLTGGCGDPAATAAAALSNGLFDQFPHALTGVLGMVDPLHGQAS
jgi:hypothetical protein